MPGCCLALIATTVWAQQPKSLNEKPFPESPTYHSRNTDKPADAAASVIAKAVGDEVTLLEEASLLIPPGQPEGQGHLLFRFTVAPDETVAWTLTFAKGEMSQSLRLARIAGAPAPSATTRGQLSRMNGWGAAIRNKGLEFTNNQKEPLPIILVVEGDIGHPFRVAIKRIRK